MEANLTYNIVDTPEALAEKMAAMKKAQEIFATYSQEHS